MATFIRSKSLSEQGEICQRGIQKCLRSHSHVRWITAWREVCPQEISGRAGEGSRKALLQHWKSYQEDGANELLGQTFSYTKVYLGNLNGEFVTLENYLDRTFQEYINNTGDIFGDGSELSMKAEAFVHYSYVASAKQLMIVDIQGVNYSLCDPEIASTTLMARDDTILFCSGNLSTTAIEAFLSKHTCNKYCLLLKLDQE